MSIEVTRKRHLKCGNSEPERQNKDKVIIHLVVNINCYTEYIQAKKICRTVELKCR